MKSLTQLHGCNPADKFANQERKTDKPQEKPFPCLKCGERFRNPAVRNQHQQACAGEREE